MIQNRFLDPDFIVCRSRSFCEFFLELGLLGRNVEGGEAPEREKINQGVDPQQNTTVGTYIDSIQVHICDHPVFPLRVLSMDSQRQILSHDSVLVDDFDTGCFEIQAEGA